MFTCYIKLTNYCNIGCDFCYLPESSRSDKTVMDNATLIRAVKLAEDSALSAGFNSVLYVIHGGEPLTISPARLENKLECLTNATNLESVLTLQTSLIPYRTEYRQIIHRFFDSYIGSSIDFSGRAISGSVESYIDLWLTKLNLARSDGHAVTPIVVPSIHELGKAGPIVEFMVSNGLQAFNIERYNSYSAEDEERPSNIQHADFLVDLTKEILERHKRGVFLAVNVVVAAIKGVLRSQPGDRWGTSCTRTFLVVNPDGETNFCPDKIEFSKTFGNVVSDTVQIIASDERIRVQKEYALNHSNVYCQRCEFNSWCNTGCPITLNSPSIEGDCSGYSSYLRWLKTIPKSELLSYLESLNFAQRGLLSIENAV